MRRSRRIGVLFVLMIGLVSIVTLGQSPRPQGASGVAPRYTKDGELVRPEGYRAWIFVGADRGLAYGTEPAKAPAERPRVEDDAAFHNIYIDRAAYESYIKTRKFPDKTVLVMEVFEAGQKEPRHIVSRGHYEARRVGLEVAVKNSERLDGSQTPWAYYNFTNPADPHAPPVKTARAQPDANCFNCHLEHADVDNVWVQFYPVLRDLDLQGAGEVGNRGKAVYSP